MSTTTLPARLRPPIRRMTCHQLAESMREIAERPHWGTAAKRQILIVANRLARATKQADQLTALDDAIALSRLGTYHRNLTAIRRLAAEAAKAIEGRSE